MCGVAGFLYKDPERTGPIGQTVLRMLDVLGSRGGDGTGVALYGVGVGGSSREKDTASLPTPDPPLPTPFVVRVVLGGHGPAHAQSARITDRVERIATVQAAEVQHDYLRLIVSDGDDPAATQQKHATDAHQNPYQGRISPRRSLAAPAALQRLGWRATQRRGPAR